jgi:hypothetical protein
MYMGQPSGSNFGIAAKEGNVKARRELLTIMPASVVNMLLDAWAAAQPPRSVQDGGRLRRQNPETRKSGRPADPSSRTIFSDHQRQHRQESGVGPSIDAAHPARSHPAVSVTW